MGVGRGNKITLTREIAVPALARPAVFRVHLLLRIQGQQRRVQAHGPGAVRPPDLPRPHHQAPHRPQGRRQLLDGHAVLQLLPGADDDRPRRSTSCSAARRRSPESTIEQRHMDLAASIQAVTEEVDAAHGPRGASAQTGMRHLVLAGGVALNCVANGRLLREGPFDDIWIQPAAGDAGGALGAALFVWHQLLDKPRVVAAAIRRRAACSARSYTTTRSVRLARRAWACRTTGPRREAELVDQVADLLADDKVIGWFQGRMEFGPRALGARSILGDPRSPRMQATMNLKIKFRESFRPFAPMRPRVRGAQVVRSRTRPDESLHAARRAGARRARASPIDERRARRWSTIRTCATRVNIPRSVIPAVTHVDYSARVQTVDAGPQPAADRAPDGVRRAAPAVRCSSTPASTSAASRSSARRRTPIAVCWRPRWTRSCSRTSSSSRVTCRTASMPPSANAISRSSSWTEGDHPSCNGPTSSNRRRRRQLRQFGGALACLLSRDRRHALVARACGRLDHQRWPSPRSLSASRACSFPAVVKPIYMGWMIAAFPIGWTVSRVALATIFFAVVTPLALVFRARGRDALRLRRETHDTYWIARRKAPAPSDYFRQF